MARSSRPTTAPRAYAHDTAHSATPWAAALRRRRLELGLTQAAVADLAAVSRRTVVALEQGRLTVTLANALAILRVLGLGLRVDRSHPGELLPVDA